MVPEDVVLNPLGAAAYFLEEAVRHGAVLLQHQPSFRPATARCGWAMVPSCIAA